MASKVKVVDSNFRQVEIKVNPGTHLTEVLEQACAKLKADPGRHLLKHKQRQLDLSHTWRTSGLVQGAKLELVVKSNTPAAIDVALQLPPPDASAFPPYGRLTEKLPSDVTIWKLLRHFESGRPSQGKPLNITGRGVPQTESGAGGSGGSGQLYYETPVLQVGNRQLATFDDFQKTLSQLGYNSGRVLIRLSFQKTDKTFVDAIADIDRYFKEETEEQTAQEPTSTDAKPTPSLDPTAASKDEPSGEQSTTSVAETTTTPARDQPDSNMPDTTTTAQEPTTGDAMDIDSAVPSSSEQQQQPPSPPPQQEQEQPSSSSASDAVRIFAAPTSATPVAALQASAEGEDAFVPGIEHAKAHQRLLKAAGQNRRLPSDQEIAEREAAERRRLADAPSVRIRVRLPDNSLLERDFGQRDTGATLYAVVRGAMAHPDAAFRLTVPPLGRDVIRDRGEGGDGDGEGKEKGKGQEDDRLIQGYRFRGQVVVTFVWDDTVPAEVRRAPFLKQSAAARAQRVVVPEVPDVADEDDGNGGAAGSHQAGSSSGGEPLAAARRGLDALKGKTPKWLKGLSKK